MTKAELEDAYHRAVVELQQAHEEVGRLRCALMRERQMRIAADRAASGLTEEDDDTED